MSNFDSCVYPFIDGTSYGKTGCICDVENNYVLNKNDSSDFIKSIKTCQQDNNLLDGF